MRQEGPRSKRRAGRSPAAASSSHDPGTHRLVVTPDAATRLAAATGWLAAIPRDAELLVLAANRHAADALVQEDVAAHGARFGVARFTLDHLASRLAAPELARNDLAPCTTLSLVAVATRAMHALLEAGAAGRFASIGRRPGFPHALVRTLEELRAAGVSPDSLREVRPWGTDLAVILERVEHELAGLKLADRAAVYAAATAVIERDANGAPAAPAGLPTLLLDVAPGSRIEQSLLAALVARSPNLLAVAPAGDPAIAALEALLGVGAEPGAVADANTSLARLQEHLFQDTRPEPRALDDGVSLMSWPGETRECVEIARRIQSAAAAGTRFDRMAVFLRAPQRYRAHLEEALRRAAIPAYFARGTTRPDPAGRALLALLACAAEGLSARRFAEYLSLAQVPDPGGPKHDAWAPPEHDLLPVRPGASAVPGGNGAATDGHDPDPDPDASVVEGTLRAPWRWERLLVDAAVIHSRDRWRRRLDGLAQEIAVRRGELIEEDARSAALARKAADIEHLREFALPIIDRLAALPAEATWAEWLGHLRGLIGAAIRHPDRLLGALAELEPLAPVGPVDLVMVQHVLSPRLRELLVPTDRRPGGAVFVGTVDMARGREFEIVFVPGLAEKLFPPRVLEDPLLPDEARKALAKAADPQRMAPPVAGTLASQESRVAGERLALRLASGAARKHVALSWPRIDLENARPRVPSFYGLEALRAAEGRLPGFDELRRRAETGGRARLGWPAPERPEQAIDDTEYDLTVLANLKDADPATSAGAANYLLTANPHLARALRARGRRWLKRWTISDGLVDPDADALAALARHQMGARAFSPTALEKFSVCPYQFFLQAIHRLQPREEMEALETIDPLTRGSLFHEVQFEVQTALRDRGDLPLDPARLENAIALLDEVVSRVAGNYEEMLAPAIPRVWTDGVNAIRADLREWLRRAAEGAEGWVPYRFELSFGLAEHARSSADTASTPEPAEVLDGARLRGSIDLVERRNDGLIRVTDHKTGKARVPEGAIVWGGQAMQPVLYALAAESVLGAEVTGGRLYYCTADGDFNERFIPLDETSRAHAGTAIGVVTRALASGFLPAAPGRDACRWCDYRLVCGPYEESRTSRKPQDRLADLKTLRSLP